MSGEKTEKATPKKRNDQRKEGNTFSSKDITTVVSLLVGFFTLSIWFPTMYENIAGFFKKYVEQMATTTEVTETVARTVFQDSAYQVVFLMAPILAVSILVTVVVTGYQTKFNFSQKALAPKFSKMNPISGLKKLFAIRSLVEVIKGLIKIAIIVAIVIEFFKGRIVNYVKTMFLGIEASAIYLLESAVNMVYMVCVIFVFIAFVDFLYQRYEYEKGIKMSKHDVKEEYKQMEGDPKIKAKIKEMQRKVAMSRMMQEVPTADVIIRNPTHFAVALRYNIDKDRAPYVVAKGQDLMALRIVKIGEEHGIHITENKELARAIYATAPVNSEIPMDFYSAVAEILALVYKLKKKKEIS